MPDFPTSGPATDVSRSTPPRDQTATAWIASARIPLGLDPRAAAVWADGSLDRIDVPCGLGAARDPVQALRAWRRVLRSGGTLRIGIPEGSPFSVEFVRSLVALVGGLEPRAGGRTALTFVRRAVAEVRQPLATLGPTLSAAAQRDPACRGELLFQVGTVLLQSGEPALAARCFERLLRLEPESAEGRFGLGMAYAGARHWDDALRELHAARRLDPENREVARWLAAVRRHAAEDKAGDPSAKWSPPPPAPRTPAFAV